MGQYSNCENVIVFYGTVRLRYDEWIRFGPVNKFLWSPTILYCNDTDTLIELGLVPLAYRNNELSFFLMATGFIDYPWNFKGYSRYGLKEKLVITDENILSGTAYNRKITVDTGNKATKISFIGDKIYPTISIKIDGKISIKLGKIFGFGCSFLFSNQWHTDAEKTISEAYQILKDTSAFLMTIHCEIHSWRSIKRYLDDYEPDESL